MAQIGGGAIAGFVIDKHLSPKLHADLEYFQLTRSKGPLGIPTPDSKEVATLSFFLEAFAVMLITIVRVTLLIDGKKFRDVSGLAVGGAYATFVMALAPLTGGCLNPARSLGSLFILDQVASNNQFFMALAPFLGAYCGMLAYKKFLISDQLQDELEEL
jgi:glycerol uptake facilitator-like aquaporin